MEPREATRIAETLFGPRKEVEAMSSIIRKVPVLVLKRERQPLIAVKVGRVQSTVLLPAISTIHLGFLSPRAVGKEV